VLLPEHDQYVCLQKESHGQNNYKPTTHRESFMMKLIPLGKPYLVYEL
jgi:hypothetical protein